MEIYLDNNATTRSFPEAVDAVSKAMSEGYGNPSSPHGRGGAARAMLVRSREAIASFAGGDPEGLVLTSGGTEANNLVFSTVSKRAAQPRIAVSAAEHPSVMKAAEAVAGRLALLPLRGNGVVDLDALSDELAKGLDLVSVQWASGETGVVQPMAEITRICRLKGVAVHSDAAQALGRVALDVARTDVDFVTLSAHKMHGPLGIGALWARDPKAILPAMLGGGQQRNLRSGTENVPGTAGFAAACAVRAGRFREDVTFMGELRDRFERAVLDVMPDAAVNCGAEVRLCNTSSIRFMGVDGQALVANLDRAGILCSQTSACSSGRPKPSRALLAMGLSEAEAWSTVRFSFSVLNTFDEADRAAGEVASAVAKLRSFMVMA